MITSGAYPSPPRLSLYGTDGAEVLQIVTAQISYRILIAGERLSHALANRATATAAAARANVSTRRR
jgi:hypothetical protein